MEIFRFWIVSPDGPSAERWADWLRREGWRAAREPAYQALLAATNGDEPGMALVDWSALGSSPLEALRAMKAKALGISIILVSGPDVLNDQVIEALDAGADDHLPRSIDEGLLRAKLRVHLRRLLPSLAAMSGVLRSRSGDLKLDRARWEAWIKNRAGKWTANTSLTRTEMQLLALFLERPGTAMERRFIVDSVWREQREAIRPGTVDKHIEALRRKLGTLGARIQTVYGVGYAFRDEG